MFVPNHIVARRMVQVSVHLVRKLLSLRILRAAALAITVLALPAIAATAPGLPGLISHSMPQFPKELVGAKAGDGEVVMVITIDLDGKVNDSVVLEATNAAFANAATDAVIDWQFSPDALPVGNPASDTWPRRQVLQFNFKRSGVVTTMSHAEAARDGFVSTSKPEIRTVLLRELDAEPQRLTAVMPSIAPAILAKRSKQPLMINFVIDREGRVRVPVVAAVEDVELAQATFVAVKKWRYQPPMHKREAVAVEVTRALALTQK